MMYKVRFSRQAVKDLHNIMEYIGFDLQSPEYAFRQFERLEKKIKGLNQMPGRFPIFRKAAWCEKNLHKMPVDNFLVFYIFDQEKYVVDILRILYGGQDIDKEISL